MAERRGVKSYIDLIIHGPKVDLVKKLDGLPLSSDVDEFLKEKSSNGKVVEGVYVSFDPIIFLNNPTDSFGYLCKDGINYAIITFQFKSDDVNGSYVILRYKHDSKDFTKLKFRAEIPR